jgi:hypothetical protein
MTVQGPPNWQPRGEQNRRTLVDSARSAPDMPSCSLRIALAPGSRMRVLYDPSLALWGHLNRRGEETLIFDQAPRTGDTFQRTDYLVGATRCPASATADPRARR